MSKLVVKRGDRYGRLTILREVEGQLHPSGQTSRTVRCRCECGNEKDIVLGRLRSGATKSCGCLHAERMTEIKTTHGCRNHPIRNTHQSMMYRCYSENSPKYQNHGGRGIKVCNEWHDIRNFVAWNESLDAENRHSKGMTLDRIDNDGDYEPGNCKWATKKAQNRNKRSTCRMNFRGLYMAVADVYDILDLEGKTPAGLSSRAAIQRYKAGLPLRECFFKPPRVRSTKWRLT